MKYLNLLIFTFLLLGESVFSQDCVDEDNVYEFSYRGRKLEFIKEKKDWFGAERCASERGGYIMAIETKDENDSLVKYLREGIVEEYGIDLIDNNKETNHYIWLGGQQLLDSWLWIYRNSRKNNTIFYSDKNGGEPVDDNFINWGTVDGERVFPVKTSGDFDVVSITLDSMFNDSDELVALEGQWINQEIEELNYFIIEYDCFDTIYAQSEFIICFGESIDFKGETITESGTYKDTLESFSFCDSIHTLTVVANDLNTQVNSNGKTISCSEINGDKYVWYNCNNESNILSENKVFYSPKETGEYKVKVTKGRCEFISDCYEVCIPNSYTLDTVKCENESITINGQEYASKGFYSQTLKQVGFDCDSTLEIDITDISFDKRIRESNDTLISFEIGAKYQWYNCEDDVLIADATQKEYAPTEDGDYKVEITKQGCIDFSSCYNYSTTSSSVKDINESDNIRLDEANRLIEFNNINYDQIELMDINSKTIYKTDQFTQSISYDYLPSGIYFLKVVTSKDVEMFKFMVVE